MAEQFANGALTTLNAAINNVVTSLVVTSVTGFPATAPFRIRIGDEILTVTAMAGTTWTVTRASEALAGVQAASAHSAGDEVRHVWTAGAAEVMVQVGDALNVVTADAGDPAYTSKAAGDTVARLTVEADGSLAWADGSNPVDLAMGRTAPGVLTIVPTGANPVALHMLAGNLADATLNLASGGLGGAVQIYAEPSGGGLLFGAAGGFDTDLFRDSGNVLATGGTFKAFALQLGDDVLLERPSANVLALGAGDVLHIPSALLILGTKNITTLDVSLPAGGTTFIPNTAIGGIGTGIFASNGNNGGAMVSWYRNGSFNGVLGTSWNSPAWEFRGSTFSAGAGFFSFFIESNLSGARLGIKNNAGFTTSVRALIF